MAKTKEAAVAAKAPRVRKGKSLASIKARSGWIFIAPFLIGFLLIYLPMIVESIQFSFNTIKVQGGGGYELKFVGLENYRWALFENTSFVRTLTSSIGSLLFNVPAIVIFSLFIAVMLNQKMRGRAIFRAIFFIPVIVSTGIIEYIDLQNSLASSMNDISSSVGAGIDASAGSGASQGNSLIGAMEIQRFFGSMAIGSQLAEYVAEIVNNVYDIINKSGVQMLIFLAGLQSVSPAIYESCQMDGATSWEIFWKITFPMISPMILVNAVYTVIDNFTSKSNAMMSLINTVYNSSSGNVRATAMAWMYFLVIILILLIVGAIMGSYVFYQRRDT